MSDSIRYNRLADVLAEKGKTGKWLAAQAKKREETISGYCTQKFQPPIYTLFELADILGVDVRELLLPNQKSPHKNFRF
jgi:putative transcriptional regulator